MRSRTPWLTGVALLLTALTWALPASIAQAHSSEVSTTPAADAVLETAPRQVSIEFDSALLDMGAALVVRDADGTSITTGAAEVGRTRVAVDVDPAAGPGTYQVAYRVVSQDGHTIEGAFAYSVAGDTASTAASSPSPSPAAASAEPTATAEATATADPATTGEEEGTSVPLILGAGALVLLLAAGAAIALRR